MTLKDLANFLPLVGVLFLVVLVMVVVLRFQQRRKGRQVSTYRRRCPFMSPAERSFFGVLCSTLDANYRVFAKVRLVDIIEPSVSKGPEFTAAFNKISRKHVDFVICEAKTMEVQCCVELDDASHRRDDRRARDSFMDQSLTAAGVPVLRVSAQRAYNAKDLQQQVMSIVAGRRA